MTPAASESVVVSRSSEDRLTVNQNRERRYLRGFPISRYCSASSSATLALIP